MVYLERIWDSQSPGEGHKIEEMLERAFIVHGWYHVYVPCGDGLVCISEIKGQSEVGQLFVLGALSGVVATSSAILFSMLF